MIFSKGDRIMFDNHIREVVCCDEEVAILGMVVPLAEKDGESINYETLIAVSNDEEFRDTIDFKFVGGKVEETESNEEEKILDVEEMAKWIRNKLSMRGLKAARIDESELVYIFNLETEYMKENGIVKD